MGRNLSVGTPCPQAEATNLEGEVVEGHGARGPGQCRGLLNPQPQGHLLLWEQQVIPVRQVRGAWGQSPLLSESTKNDLPTGFPNLFSGLSRSCQQTCFPRERGTLSSLAVTSTGEPIPAGEQPGRAPGSRALSPLGPHRRSPSRNRSFSSGRTRWDLLAAPP